MEKRDPRFGAALIKHAFLTGSPAPGYLEIYQGALRDLGLTDEEVARYLEEHRAEIEEASRRLKAAGKG